MGRRVEGSSGEPGTGGCCGVVDDVPPESGRPHDSSIRSWMPARVAASSLLHGRSPPTTSCSSWNNQKNYRQNKQEYGTSSCNREIDNSVCYVVFRSKHNDNILLIWWSQNATPVARWGNCSDVKMPNERTSPPTTTRQNHRKELIWNLYVFQSEDGNVSCLATGLRIFKAPSQICEKWLSLVVSLRLSISAQPSVHMEKKLTLTGRISAKFDVGGSFENLSRKFKFHYDLTKIPGTLHLL